MEMKPKTLVNSMFNGYSMLVRSYAILPSTFTPLHILALAPRIHPNNNKIFKFRHAFFDKKGPCSSSFIHLFSVTASDMARLVRVDTEGAGAAWMHLGIAKGYDGGRVEKTQRALKA